MKNGTEFFTKDRRFYRSFFVLTAMMALQNVVTCSVNLADNIMLGGYSEEALSGVALANQIQFILQMLTMGTVSYTHLDVYKRQLLITVEQTGNACHTGAHSCFFNQIK